MPLDSAQIPLDAGMWLDDLTPPSALASAANAPRFSSSSLEESLGLLHAHTDSTPDAALAFDAADQDHDVHALFPMLSEASFDFDDAAHDRTRDPSPASFPNDLSPILTAMPMPKALALESLATPTTAIANVLRPRRKSVSTPKTSMAPTPLGLAIPFPPEMTATPPAANRKRRRRLRSTSLSATLTHWTEHEQNAFFLVFKPKWPIASPSPEQFATLLLERFDAVSDKLRSTHKTSHDAEAFYTTMLQSITDLLDAVAPHDIDLLNPDEIRIALSCWRKLLSDSQKRQALEHVEDATEEQKKPLAQELLQSIVRSRRQMLKAKSAAAAETLLPPALGDEEEMASLEGLLREALEHSTLPSYLYQLAPVDTNAAPVVHHPAVRRKSTEKQLQLQPATIEAAGAGQKRPRSESVELYHSFTNGTPLKSLASIAEGSDSQASYVTPPVGNPSKKTKHETQKQNQTPPQSARKKIYIKLRMVPRDTQTKDVVERSGCNPKVELKLNGTKRVADVLDHMAKKWASVRALVDTQATLHFYEKDSGALSPEVPASAASNKEVGSSSDQSSSVKSWSRRNHDVTCFDIWKQSGKMKNDEYIAVVSYQWRVEDAVDTTSEDAGGEADSTPLLDLLDEHTGTTTRKHLQFDHDDCSSKDNSPFASPLFLSEQADRTAVQVLPLEKKASSLQAFSETVAFDTKPFVPTAAETTEEQLSLASLPEDALSELMEFSPNSQRLRRRRITPVLVATSECQI